MQIEDYLYLKKLHELQTSKKPKVVMKSSGKNSFFQGFSIPNNWSFSVLDREVASCACILGCDAASFTFKYLGVPICANMSLKGIDNLSLRKCKEYSTLGKLGICHLTVG